MRYSLRYLLGFWTVCTVACWYVLVATPQPRDAGAWWVTASPAVLGIALMVVGGKLGADFPVRGTVLGAWVVCVATMVLVVCVLSSGGGGRTTGDEWRIAGTLFIAAVVHAAVVGGGIELVQKGHDEGAVLILFVVVDLFALCASVPAVH